MRWQPIETAPCDGRAILVYRPHAPTARMIGIDARHPGRFNGQWQHSRGDEQPAAWMELALPPG